MTSRTSISLAALGLTVVTLGAMLPTFQITLLPVPQAFASESSGGGGGGGGGGSGSHSGNDTRRMASVALFTAIKLFPSVLEQPKQPADRLSYVEKLYLCSMARVHHYDEVSRQEFFIPFLASLLGRSVDQVRAGLSDEDFCPDTRW
jgi:hypothetical protein